MEDIQSATSTLRLDGHWKTPYHVGQAFSRQNKHDEAIAKFTEALPQAHTDGTLAALTVLDARANANAAQSKIVAALGDAQTCIALAPESYHGHNRVAMLCMQTGEPGTAVEHFKRALSFVPLECVSEHREITKQLEQAIAAAGIPVIRKDPMGVLPYDVLERILEMIVDDNDPDIGVRLSEVSKPWRQFVLNCPTAWKFYSFDFGTKENKFKTKADPLIKLTTWLSRSNRRILTMRLIGMATKLKTPRNRVEHEDFTHQVVSACLPTLKVLILDGKHNHTFTRIITDMLEGNHRACENLERLDLWNMGSPTAVGRVSRFDGGILSTNAPIQVIKSSFPVWGNTRRAWDDDQFSRVRKLRLNADAFFAGMIKNYWVEIALLLGIGDEDREEMLATPVPLTTRNLMSYFPHLESLSLTPPFKYDEESANTFEHDISFFNQDHVNQQGLVVLSELKKLKTYEMKGFSGIRMPNLEHLEFLPLSLDNRRHVRMLDPLDALYVEFPWSNIKTLVAHDRSTGFLARILPKMTALESLTIPHGVRDEVLELLGMENVCPRLTSLSLSRGGATTEGLMQLVATRLSRYEAWEAAQSSHSQTQETSTTPEDAAMTDQPTNGAEIATAATATAATAATAATTNDDDMQAEPTSTHTRPYKIQRLYVSRLPHAFQTAHEIAWFHVNVPEFELHRPEPAQPSSSKTGTASASARARLANARARNGRLRNRRP